MRSGRAVTKTAFYNNPKFRSAFYQLAVLAAVVWFGVEFAINARANLEAQNVRFGLRFLDDPAGFGISQTLIPYSEQDTYRRVFFVGLLNTLLVSALGIVFATILGFCHRARAAEPQLAAGAARRRLCRAHPQSAAPVPDPVLVSRRSPGDAGAAPEHRRRSAAAAAVRGGRLRISGAFRRAGGHRAVVAQPGGMDRAAGGLSEQPRRDHAAAIFGEGSGIVVAALVMAVLAVIGLRVWARRRQDATGARFPVLWTSLALLIGLPTLATLRDRLAGQLRGAGAARLQFRRRHAGDSGIHRAADRAHDLYRRLHRRGGPRRRAGGAEGADRGGHGARAAAQDDAAPDRGAAGHAGDHPAADQPVSQPDQEFDARRRASAIPTWSRCSPARR